MSSKNLLFFKKVFSLLLCLILLFVQPMSALAGEGDLVLEPGFSVSIEFPEGGGDETVYIKVPEGVELDSATLDVAGTAVTHFDEEFYGTLNGISAKIYGQGVNGSNLAFSDLDSDGDIDMLAGGVSGTLTLYKNQLIDTGTAGWGTVEENFANIDVGSNSTPVFVNIDSDLDEELVIGKGNGTIDLYENTGRAGWVLVQENYNNIDVGYAAIPAFADIDNDVDMDMFVGAHDGTINFYENIGSGAWAPVQKDYYGIDVGKYSSPIFVDMDNDADMDMFVGEWDGTVYFYKNQQQETGSLDWELVDENYNGIDVGTRGTPAFADIDNDADMDLFMGEWSGTINFYENVGEGNWAPVQEQFSRLNVDFRSSPAFVDIDNDADMDLFMGEYSGTINFVENTGEESWALIQSNYDNIDAGAYSNPTFADVDEDSDMDMFIGKENGTIDFYENIGGGNWASVQPNYNGIVASYGNSAPVFVDIDNDLDMDLFVGSYEGKIDFYENLGAGSFASVQSNYNGIDVGKSCAPAFADIDNDSDMDMFVGADDGTVRFYENWGDGNWAPVKGNYAGIAIPLGSSAPTFIDIDIDNDMDMFVGALDGNIYFYRNSGLAPSNSMLDVAANQVIDWSYTGGFLSSETIPNFSDGINEFVSNYTGEVQNGEIFVPITVHSDTAGILELSNLALVEKSVEPVYGDLTGDGLVTVSDAQCTVLVNLWVLGEKVDSVPECLSNNEDPLAWMLADVDCNEEISVVDILLIVDLALGNPLDYQIDGNQNQRHDACEA